MTNCIFTNMELSDYDQVYELWTKTPGIGLNEYDDSKDGISRYLKRNPKSSFVAKKNNKVIGVILSGHDGRRGLIHHMCVDESFQGKGIGNTLLKMALDSLKNEGIVKVIAIVFKDNELGNTYWEKKRFDLREDLNYRNKYI